MNQFYPNLFSPFTIKKTRFKNRIFSAPNNISWYTADSLPDDVYIRYIETKAAGGAAQVTIPGGDVQRPPLGADAGPHLYMRERRSNMRMSELVKAIHRHGSVASLELGHIGLHGGNPPKGPSPCIRWDGVEVLEMTREDMDAIIADFVEGARLAKVFGFDAVMVHGGHGWLFGQFLADDINHRTDEFGGCMENKARFPIMVLDAIRAEVGEDFLIELRISGDDMYEGGCRLKDSIEFCKLVQDKVDLIHVSAGRDAEDDGSCVVHPTIFSKNGCNVYMAEAIRKEVHVPVVTVGAINTPELAEEIIATGKADFVAMARALIADPDFVNKAKLGKRDEIIPCVRCLNCLTGLQMKDSFDCSVNPRSGREALLLERPVNEKQRVVIIGGGPAGMNAAITAAKRGHQVTLLEKSGSLGGLIRFSDFDDMKIDLRRLKDYFVGMVEKLPVKVLLNTEATPELVASLKPDAVIVATGSVPAVPPIPGLKEYATHVCDMYYDMDSVGHHVILCGGGLAGCETAAYLAERGHQVDIVEMRPELAPDANWMQQEGMKVPIAKYGIGVHTSTTCLAIQENGVLVRNEDGSEQFIEGDTVIYALGMKGNSCDLERFEAICDNVSAVGDCVQARTVMAAIHESYHAVMDLGVL